MLFISNVERLKLHWLSHDVKFNAGVSEAALAAFEQEFGVSLPSDLREYFLTMDGMPEYETDTEMFRLLSTPSDKNEIFIIGGDYPTLLFKSFSELVDSYLTDKNLMFG